MFYLSREEYNMFDQHNEISVDNFLNLNKHLCTPYTTADLQRLEPNNQLTFPITLPQIQSIIKLFKKTTPLKQSQLIRKFLMT